jgi:hypothetical protein
MTGNSLMERLNQDKMSSCWGVGACNFGAKFGEYQNLNFPLVVIPNAFYVSISFKVFVYRMLY